MEQVACLDLVKWDDDILEENDMLFSQGYCKTADDTGKNIEQF
jgi:hypothetical protein